MGGNFVEEEKEEIKKIEEEIKDVNPINNIEDKEDKLIIEEENKLNDDTNLNNNNEQQMNLPLCLNTDSPFLNPNNSIDSSKNQLNKIINQEKKIEDNNIILNSNLDNKDNKDNNIN